MVSKTPKPPVHKWLSLLGDWVDINREIENSGDRTKAIVAASYVENNLALAIATRLRFLDPQGQKFLYDDEYAPLKDFASKINLGWALNLYDIKVREDLHCIRKIRNKFAHLLSVRDFDHGEVRAYCDRLVGVNYIDLPRGKTGPRDRRDRYLDLVAHLGERFAMDCAAFHPPPPSPNKIRPDY